MTIEVTPLSPYVGVEITGMSGPLAFDADAAERCQQLLDRHGVVVFRDANIDDDTLVAFSGRMGT